MIKDSGDRTEFETGAKRDMHAGKGRMDLLPWYGIMEVSKHCEEGALKYGEHNVDKGIPLHSLLDSASRHLAKYMVGMDDEDHLRAACWNLLWALNQRETHPELDEGGSHLRWMQSQKVLNVRTIFANRLYASVVTRAVLNLLSPKNNGRPLWKSRHRLVIPFLDGAAIA